MKDFVLSDTHQWGFWPRGFDPVGVMSIYPISNMQNETIYSNVGVEFCWINKIFS